MTGAPPAPAGLAAALTYASRGWYVFPAADKKTPHVRWSTAASHDAGVITRWWRRWPSAWVCIATGPSDLLVVDVDGPEGSRGWAALNDAEPQPATLTVKSPRGWHYYYTGHGESTVGRIAPNIDTRGQGGYIVAPGSPGYTWMDVPAAITSVSTSVIARLARTPPATTTVTSPARAARTMRAQTRGTSEGSATTTSRFFLAALNSEAKIVASASPGTRNRILNRAAGNIGTLIPEHGGESQARDALLTAAIGVGLGQRESIASIDSGFAWGKQRPRGQRRVQ